MRLNGLDAFVRDFFHIIKFLHVIDRSKLQNAMQDIFASVPDIGYEIGVFPGGENLSYIALSIPVENEWREEVGRRILAAETSPGWRVELGIPPRDWEMYFEIYDDESQEWVSIDGRQWCYKFVRSGSTNTLELCNATGEAYGQRIFDDIAKILLVGEIGERNIEKHNITFKLVMCDKTYLPLSSFAPWFAENVKSACFRDVLMRKVDGTIR